MIHEEEGGGGRWENSLGSFIDEPELAQQPDQPPILQLSHQLPLDRVLSPVPKTHDVSFVCEEEKVESVKKRENLHQTGIEFINDPRIHQSHYFLYRFPRSRFRQQVEDDVLEIW